LNLTVDGTLFLVDLGTLKVTICTWQGGEALLPVSHLCAFVDHLRTVQVALPELPAVISSVAEP